MSTSTKNAGHAIFAGGLDQGRGRGRGHCNDVRGRGRGGNYGNGGGRWATHNSSSTQNASSGKSNGAVAALPSTRKYSRCGRASHMVETGPAVDIPAPEGTAAMTSVEVSIDIAVAFKSHVATGDFGVGSDNRF